jgi:hypothetical protein
MKKSIFVIATGIFIIPIIIALSITGCSTTPVPYSFATDGAQTATISVVRGNPGVNLIYVDENELPEPAKKTHWSPFTVTAGQPIKMTVHAYYQQSNTSDQGLLVALATSAITASRSVDKDVTIECPPLEADKNYKLVFRKGAGVTGKNVLVLTDISTGKIVYDQEFDSK